MHFKNLTFNDLPTVVGELCKRIESLETVLKNSLAVQNKVKENHHVPMTVDEVCTYLGISKSSFYYKVKHGGIPVIKQGKHLFAAGDKENALEREVIWWKVDYKQSDSLNQYQRGDRVRLGIAPGDIMLLKEG